MPHLKGEKPTTPPASVATAPSVPVTSLSTKKSATMKPVQYTDIENGDGVDRQQQQQQKEGKKLPAASKSERQPPEKHPQQQQPPPPQAPRGSSPQTVNVAKAAKKRRRSTSNESGKDKKKGNISPKPPQQKQQQKQLKGLKLKSTQSLQPAAAVVLQHKKKLSPSASSSPPSSLPRNSKKKVEMQYLYKNKKIKVKLFDTLHKASDKTGISIPMIKVVCEEGGGFINEKWFEYHQPIIISSDGGTNDHHGTTPPSHTATTTTTTMNSEISTTNHKNHLTTTTTTTDTDPENPSHKKNHIGRQSIVPKRREFFMGGTSKFDVTSLRPLDPKTCKLSTSTGGAPLVRGGTTTSSPGGAARRTRRKRVIELICKKTGQTLVCFSEIQHAAMALGITPEQATRACSSYGTPEQYEFLEFQLRFKVDSKVYLYGSNEEDFQPTGITDDAGAPNTSTLRDSQDETHRERLARWSRLMAKAGTTKSPSSPQPSPPKPSKIMTTTVAAKAVTLPAATTAASTAASTATTSPARPPPPPRRVVEKEETTTYHEIIPDEQVVQETLKLFEDTFMVDSSMSMSSSKSPVSMAMVPILTDNNPPNETMESLCIFCQEQSAGIIFEPCGHCVVCEDCASWACRHFCPRCRTSIFKRRRSTSLFRGVKLDLALKPTTFSAYSFMDF